MRPIVTRISGDTTKLGSSASSWSALRVRRPKEADDGSSSPRSTAGFDSWEIGGSFASHAEARVRRAVGRSRTRVSTLLREVEPTARVLVRHAGGGDSSSGAIRRRVDGDKANCSCSFDRTGVIGLSAAPSSLGSIRDSRTAGEGELPRIIADPSGVSVATCGRLFVGRAGSVI